jgi:hypothetical protein
MADELKIAIQATYTKNGRTLTIPAESDSVTVTGNKVVSGVMLATQASAIAVPIGGIGTVGYCIFKNLNATNYVNIGVDDSGLVVQTTLLAGEQCILRMTGAPYVQADTADCLLSYTVIEA